MERSQRHLISWDLLSIVGNGRKSGRFCVKLKSKQKEICTEVESYERMVI